MRKIIGYAGAMWAGKTTKLVENLSGHVLAIDHRANTRSSDRELHAILNPLRDRDAKIQYAFLEDFPTRESGCVSLRTYSYILIDEIHFVDVFSRESRLEFILNEMHCEEFRVAGIKRNCYNLHIEFPVWHYLRSHGAEIIEAPSLKPCAICGCKDPTLTIPIGNFGNVGDHYAVVCESCEREVSHRKSESEDSAEKL